VGLSRPNAPPFVSGLCQFFSAHAARCRVLDDAHGQGILLAAAYAAGDVETPAHESALDAPQLRAVQVNVGLPVDPVEIQPDMLPLAAGATNSLRYQKSA